MSSRDTASPLPTASENIGAIFIHGGAGYHNPRNDATYLRLLERACNAAMMRIKAGEPATCAVEAGIKVMEDSDLTNAGIGSNLNYEGIVEADAAIVDHRGRSGACGAAPGIKNPISLAKKILDNRVTCKSSLILPPQLLCGEGARKYAGQHGLELCLNESLITKNSLSSWKKWKSFVGSREQPAKGQNEQHEPPEGIQDTVGAIAIDLKGNMAAGSSSGGHALKQPGRLGPAAIVGAGTAVWTRDDGLMFSDDDFMIATVCSGTGEYINEVQAASRWNMALAYGEQHDLGGEWETRLKKSLWENGATLGWHNGKPQGRCDFGVISVKQRPSGFYFQWEHSTESLAVAYQSTTQEKATRIMSRASRDVHLGKLIITGGGYKPTAPRKTGSRDDWSSFSASDTE